MCISNLFRNIFTFTDIRLVLDVNPAVYIVRKIMELTVKLCEPASQDLTVLALQTVSKMFGSQFRQ